MKILERNKWLLIFGASLTGFAAHAQVPANPADIPAFRKGTVVTTLAKVNKLHYNPRIIDNAYSEAVWKSFIQILDPNKVIFLQDDLNVLADFKQTIDDDFNEGQTRFFDATYAIYMRRLKQMNDQYKVILATPFDFSKKESTILNRKNLPAPASLHEQEDIWQKRLKYTTLANYQEMLAAAGKATEKVDADIEAKARIKTRKANDLFFRKALSQKNANDVFTQYMTVALLEIDPHTAFAGPKDNSLTQQLNKMYFGLGIELGIREADYFVNHMTPGGAAFKSGVVKELDNVIAISDGNGKMQEVSGLEATEVANMIRGEKGTSVSLILQQPGEVSRTVTVKREEVNDIENRAKSAIIEQGSKRFGYIYLPIFYQDQSGQNLNGAAADIQREVEKLKAEEVDGMVMDLRGNGGGSLDEVVKMTSAFLPEGPVSWLRGKDKIDRYGTTNPQAMYDGPLTVMVDEGSASASEIFAAAMQDRGRAIIVGAASSYGKGTAQVNVNIGRMGDSALATKDVNYGNMRLTVQKFYRVSGNATQLKGIIPDVVLQHSIRTGFPMEKDFNSALPFDSMILQPYVRLPFTFNYDTVIARANIRVKNNAAFNKVAAYTQKLTASVDQPTLLDLAGFSKQYKQLDNYKKEIRKNKELPEAKQLTVVPSVYRDLNPAFKSPANEKSKGYLDMIERLKKDIYLSETIAVLSDMTNGTIE